MINGSRKQFGLFLSHVHAELLLTSLNPLKLEDTLKDVLHTRFLIRLVLILAFLLVSVVAIYPDLKT